MNINTLSGGGYYQLEKVLQFPGDTNWFFDIYILVEKVDDVEILDKIKIY